MAGTLALAAMRALLGGEVARILKSIPDTRKIFKGIKTRDIVIPKHVSKPSGYVLNNGYSYDGEHWVAVIFTSEKVLFFDSFGRAPSELFLSSQAKRYGLSIEYNPWSLQARRSPCCGFWCIYYFYFLCKGFKFKEINARFSRTNFKNNDHIVYTFVKKLATQCCPPLKKYSFLKPI